MAGTVLLQQQGMCAGSTERLQLCTATFGYVTAGAKIEAARAGYAGKGWKHEQGAGEGRAEREHMQRGWERNYFLGKNKPKHYSVISVHNIFVIPSPIQFSKKQKDFSTPILP